MWDKATIEGYVNATSEYSKVLENNPLHRFREIIEPGAITRSINRHGSVRLTFNHNRVIASQRDVEIHETPEGFRFKAKIDDLEVIAKAMQGKLLGCSFSFWVLDDDVKKDKVSTKIIKELLLLEISILDVSPAYTSGVKVINIPSSMNMDLAEYRIRLLK